MTHKKKKHHHNNEQLQQQQQQQQEQQTAPDLTLTHGYAYISLEGTFIDAIAQRHDSIPDHMIKNRINRDGSPKSHVTILHPKELKQALEAANIELPKKKHKSQALKKLIQWIIDHVGEPTSWSKGEGWPKDLGLAYVEKQEDDNNEATTSQAYFHVLHWPLGHKIRQMLHLEPAFFHVTVGFNPKDVHGLYKGPGTLVSLMDNSHRHKRFQQTEEKQTIIELTHLLKISSQYTKDKVFLNALANRCTCYQEVLDACSTEWTFVQQFITTSTQEDVDEACKKLEYLDTSE